ncbi:MAG: cysteine synthase family protein [Acidimicrobiia bacterium]|nr:MAG: cysteine synthase family protein [Acidimicrobiia bacterium]
MVTRSRSIPPLLSDPALRRFEDIRDLLPDIDNPTPLVRVHNAVSADNVYLKLEWLNPFGSIKDRAVSYLIRGLERDGVLEDHQIVEASSGNTAIALAAISAIDGTTVTITIPDGVPEETKTILRMLGAEVWETPDELCPVDHPKDGAIALARSLAASEGGSRYVMLDQYENPENVRAHYETTGPEIWKQTEGEVTAFFAGFGTCGTITGVGRYLKEQNPDVRIIAIEPQKGHRLPGLKSFAEANEPGNLDRSVIDDAVTVPDDAAYAMTLKLHREDGLLVGPSTGAIVHAIDTYRDFTEGVVVGVSPDSGAKYTTYFKELLGAEGLPTI